MGDMKPPDYTLPLDHVYSKPEKVIKNMSEMPLWEKSEAYLELTGFVLSLNDAVKGKNLASTCHISDVTKNLVNLLDKLDALIKECPPIEQPQRFGNAAFRAWFNELKNLSRSNDDLCGLVGRILECRFGKEVYVINHLFVRRTKLSYATLVFPKYRPQRSLDLLQEALPQNYHKSLIEVRVYLEESFGNSTRIDYGTGHETAFVMFLCCLYKIGALTAADKVATVGLVFNRYLELVRNLQQTYRMEPAGSHGVWSLDDFQFIPFIWGSSQLIGHPIIEPHKFLDEEVLAKFGKSFMFLSCIEYINKVKTGPFAEHSNQLWGISAVSSWTKINQGLVKMYKKEVLGKFPVVQHMLFGSILPMRPMIGK